MYRLTNFLTAMDERNAYTMLHGLRYLWPTLYTGQPVMVSGDPGDTPIVVEMFF